MSEENEPSSDEGGECPIDIHIEAQPGALTPRRIEQAIQITLADRFINALSAALVDDATMCRLHHDYMNDPTPTDVLTFDLRESPDDPAIEGEIVVSVDTARKQAKQYGCTVEDEILRYVIHGSLHLAGMDDRTEHDAEAMRREEDRVLSKLHAGAADGEANHR